MSMTMASCRSTASSRSVEPSCHASSSLKEVHCSSRSWRAMRSRSSSVSAIFCLLFQQHSPDRCGHEVGNGAGEHGAQAEAGELVAAFRDECADAADLNTDGAEIG